MNNALAVSHLENAVIHYSTVCYNRIDKRLFLMQSIGMMEGLDMYFVDRDSIEKTLVFLDKQIDLFVTHGQWASEIEKAALERLTHTMIESMIDVGNMMIDGFIMRDPGSYEDIIDILNDEKVINAEMHKSLVTIIHCRKMLVQNYPNVDHEALEQTFKNELPSLQQFSSSIREYLINELGPVSAFRK